MSRLWIDLFAFSAYFFFFRQTIFFGSADFFAWQIVLQSWSLCVVFQPVNMKNMGSSGRSCFFSLFASVFDLSLSYFLFLVSSGNFPQSLSQVELSWRVGNVSLLSLVLSTSLTLFSPSFIFLQKNAKEMVFH